MRQISVMLIVLLDGFLGGSQKSCNSVGDTKKAYYIHGEHQEAQRAT